MGQAFVAGRPSCTSGYYHGILERAFLGISQNHLGSAARRFCSDPVIRKYTGVLGAADVYTASSAFVLLEAIRLDLGVGSQVHP